jgi:hypothetical protein
MMFITMTIADHIISIIQHQDQLITSIIVTPLHVATDTIETLLGTPVGDTVGRLQDIIILVEEDDKYK